MQEVSTSVQTEKKQALYVYDRICTKESKTRQILQEYRTFAGDSPDAQPNARTERPLGRAFAESQRKRAEDYFLGHPEREGTASKTAWEASSASSSARKEKTSHFVDSSGNEYSYRPAPPEGGGAAVREQPLRLLLKRLSGMFEAFESLEARKERDENAAKRQAIARKKFSEHRHALITALLLLLAVTLCVIFIYLAFFKISDVEVEGTELYTDPEIVAAAGFASGDQLYSFHAGRAEELIQFHCPQIRTAQISRTLPNAVDIVLTDDVPVFYADIYGDTAILSAGLRVLGYTDEASAEADGLLQLTLPAVQSSVAGRVLSFTEERDQWYVRSVLGDIMASSLYEEERIGYIDVSEEFNIKLHCDGQYILRLGSRDECELKLLMAYRSIREFDRDLPALLDLREPGEASVRFDPALVLE